MAMSTYFATHKTLVPTTANDEIPIHIFHGTQDPMVPAAMATHALEALKTLGRNPAFKTYPMGHEVHPQEIKDISTWLQLVLNK